MSFGPLASEGSGSKRQRALPIPRASASMQAFTPDSSIASDVIPSPNFGERSNGRRADMIVLHYTGMPDVEGAHARLCTRRQRRLGALHRSGGWPHRTMRVPRPSAPGMPARRHGRAKQTSIPVRSASRSSIGGHDWGYPDFPLRQIAAVIALCRGIMLRLNVPSHRVLGHSDVAPLAQEGSRREISLGIRWPIPASVTGCSRRRSCVAEPLKLGDRRRRRPRDAASAGAIRLRRCGQRKI